MKLIITEAQHNRIKSLLKESVSTDSYTQEVTLKFNGYSSTLKNHEINYINPVKVNLNFYITFDVKSWGVRGISVYGISGPTEVEITVDYYDVDEEERSIEVPIRIDWESAVINEDKLGFIGIDDSAEVTLVNDSEGNLVVKSVELTVSQL